jgi:hypothetical protein
MVCPPIPLSLSFVLQRDRKKYVEKREPIIATISRNVIVVNLAKLSGIPERVAFVLQNRKYWKPRAQQIAKPIYRVGDVIKTTLNI